MKDLIKKLPLAERIYGRLYFLHYLRQRSNLSGTTSYANSEEDLMARDYLGSVRYFVDIGAAAGKVGSNTFYFAVRGARGVCFEPLRESYLKLRCLYFFNRRIVCRNCGISDKAGDAEIAHVGDWSYILETEDHAHTLLHPRGREHKTVTRVRLLTFDEATRGVDLPKVIDLLSIDVEGHELNVLRSVPFERFDFRLIILETHLRGDNGECVWTHRDIDQIGTLLAQYGYRPVGQTTANTFYSREGRPLLPISH